MTDRLDVRTRFVNSCVDPKFCIGATISRELITFDVELEQIIDSHERRTHSRRKNEPIGAWHTCAHMAECRRDALLVQNMAGGNDVLLDLVYVHWF